jgi:hypothetical protein
LTGSEHYFNPAILYCPPKFQIRLSSNSNTTTMRIVIKCENKPNEWCIVEVQGSIDPRKGEALDGLPLGEFSVRDVRIITKIILILYIY